MGNTTLVLIYLAPVSFYYNYSFFHDLLFMYPEAYIGVVKEKFEFLESSSISTSKKLL